MHHVHFWFYCRMFEIRRARRPAACSIRLGITGRVSQFNVLLVDSTQCLLCRGGRPAAQHRKNLRLNRENRPPAVLNATGIPIVHDFVSVIICDLNY
jgi:hypothetical protein